MDSYYTLEVIDINKDYDDTLCLTLLEKNNKFKSFQAGQFLTLLIDVQGEEVRRSFSISSSPEELPKIMLAIKKVNDGVISGHLFNKIAVGDTLKVLPPLGNFTVTTSPENERHIVMFGAGSGITPLFSQLKSILNNEPNSKVTLLYGNRTESSVIYKKELDDLQNIYNSRFIIKHHLTQPHEGWDGFEGRITKETVVNFLLSTPDAVGTAVEYYLCGPDEMMQSVISAITEQGVSTKKIHREVYNTSVVEKDESIEIIQREVTIIFKGDEFKILVEPGKTILQTALDAGIKLPNSCQFGSCATCKAKLLSGRLQLIDQTALTEEELENGFCLTCVGHPASDNVVILYEDQF
ncbi:MAG: ferredoxin--NADP reductase [Bacteroidetes bacterium]|nr:ferredoxin--NADP reductase [Bacteroidota bacterium]